MFNSLLAFCFWKACTFSSFERFLCLKSRNCSQISISEIINYWGSTLTLYLKWGAFSLVCVVSVFFSLFISLFFTFSIGLFLDRHSRSIRWDGRGNHYFSCFLLPLTNNHLILRDFYHLFLLDLFVISRLIADGTFST